MVAWLKSNNLEIRRYENQFRGGIPMTEKERERLAVVLPQQYERVLRPLMLRTKVRQEVVDERLDMARKRSLAILRRERTGEPTTP